MNLLLIEDNNEEAITIKDELKNEYSISILPGTASFRYLSFVNNYDLIIINFLFCVSKAALCKAIRKENAGIPILVLGKNREVDIKVQLLDSGADDYLVKPFEPAELRARVRALLRRHKKSAPHKILKIANLTFDTDTKVARSGEWVLILRRKEAMILEYLMSNASRVLTRGMILDHVWDGEYEAYQNVVDVHMKHLRDKIDRGHKRKLIKTIYGFGYKIE